MADLNDVFKEYVTEILNEELDSLVGDKVAEEFKNFTVHANDVEDLEGEIETVVDDKINSINASELDNFESEVESVVDARLNDFEIEADNVTGLEDFVNAQMDERQNLATTANVVLTYLSSKEGEQLLLDAVHKKLADLLGFKADTPMGIMQDKLKDMGFSPH